MGGAGGGGMVRLPAPAPAPLDPQQQRAEKLKQLIQELQPVCRVASLGEMLMGGTTRRRAASFSPHRPCFRELGAGHAGADALMMRCARR
jgi:hypothetical protein